MTVYNAGLFPASTGSFYILHYLDAHLGTYCIQKVQSYWFYTKWPLMFLLHRPQWMMLPLCSWVFLISAVQSLPLCLTGWCWAGGIKERLCNFWACRIGKSRLGNRRGSRLVKLECSGSSCSSDCFASEGCCYTTVPWNVSLVFPSHDDDGDFGITDILCL